MTSIETTTTPRYRNFSNNMPSSINATPRTAPSTSLITVEKEPERDPEEDCFMCRQAHVYVKPIGMQQERRVARRNPPSLTRTQIDDLSRKPHLTKQEVRKLLQSYFPEIKNVKYFQLHKYHSCCYDPKHLSLCKNHITALQHEREQHPNHHHHKNGGENNDDHYKDYERDGAKHNRVSFVRIKIEPTKGIPTRFLGPTALPESLADMLMKQVSRLEDKKVRPTFSPNNTSKSYNATHSDDPYGSDDDDDDNDEDDSADDDANQSTYVKDKIITPSGTNYGNNMDQKPKSANGDLVVEDLDELNRLYINRDEPKHTNGNLQMFSKPLKRKKRKKVTKKKNPDGQNKLKLNHWELKALEQSNQDSCNCRHQVMRLEGDQVVYDWCRCKDHQHKELMERHKSIALPPPPPEEPTQPASPPPPPRPKPRKVRRKSIGIDATGLQTTELALAYDPSAVDYDRIQEVIYYRTSSGRLIKPEISNAFTYDGMGPSMTINNNDSIQNKAEVLYMTDNGQLQSFDGGGRYQGKTMNRSSPARSIILTNSGSLYNGQANIDPGHSSSHNGAMRLLRLPPSLTSSRQQLRDNNNEYQPAEFTLAKFSPDKSIDTPISRRSPASGSQGKSRPVPVSMQKSTKPTYSNLEPTPDYGRESSVVANRRWFDQPLGDQNLRPVHDGQYGLIAGTSTNQYTTKSQLPDNEYADLNIPKTGGNCTIS